MWPWIASFCGDGNGVWCCSALWRKSQHCSKGAGGDSSDGQYRPKCTDKTFGFSKRDPSNGSGISDRPMHQCSGAVTRCNREFGAFYGDRCGMRSAKSGKDRRDKWRAQRENALNDKTGGRRSAEAAIAAGAGCIFAGMSWKCCRNRSRKSSRTILPTGVCYYRFGWSLERVWQIHSGISYAARAAGMSEIFDGVWWSCSRSGFFTSQRAVGGA